MFPAMRTAAAAIAVAALLNAPATKPEIYRNPEFGIVLPAPAGALLCTTPQDEHDHGPYMLLATADSKGCHDIEHHRSVDVFASYNVSDETKKLHEFLRWECAHVAKGPCRPAPGGLRVPGLPSAAARVNRSDGWIDIIVVTQAGTPDPEFDPSVPFINYDLGLHTRPNYLGADLRVFRIVLQTIRLSPPPPASVGRPITTH